MVKSQYMEQPQRDDGFYILSSLRICKGGQLNSFFNYKSFAKA